MTQKADLKKDNHTEEYVQSNIDDFIPKEEVDNFSANQQNSQQEIIVNTKLEDENLKQIQDQTIMLQKKKLDEVEQSVSKRNSKKNKILNIIFFIVNVVVVAGILIYQLLKEDIQAIRGRFDIGSIFVIVALLGLVIFSETAAISYLLKISTGKWRFGLAYKVSQLGKYYDSVTPMATG